MIIAHHNLSKKTMILTVLIFCTLMIQAQSKTEILFNDVLKPEEIYIYGQNVYITERGVINVFSLTNGKKLWQLTKKGEGPDEFKSSPSLTFFPEYIVASAEGKVIFYRWDGKKINEKRVPLNMRMFPVKGNYIGDREIMDKNLNRFVTKTFLYNAEFQEIACLNTGVVESMVVVGSNGKMHRQNYYMIPNGYGVITDGNHICVYDSQKGFFIKVYNHEGNKISTINKDYPKVKVSRIYKNQKMDALKKDKNWGQLKMMFDFVFPDYFPSFRRVYINNGLIYILTDTPNENERTLLVMEFSGKILGKSVIPKQYYQYFNKGRLYYFEEREGEKWILRIQKLF